jgi:hypothetical protein
MGTVVRLGLPYRPAYEVHQVLVARVLQATSLELFAQPVFVIVFG